MARWSSSAARRRGASTTSTSTTSPTGDPSHATATVATDFHLRTGARMSGHARQAQRATAKEQRRRTPKKPKLRLVTVEVSAHFVLDDGKELTELPPQQARVAAKLW